MCTGPKIKVEKTKAKYKGSFCDRVNSRWGYIAWSNDYSEIPGVILIINKRYLYNLNFKNRLLNLKNLIRLWKSRHLSLKKE